MAVNLQPKRNLEQSWIIRCLSAFLLFGQILLHFIRGKTYYRKILEHTVTAGPASIPPVLLVSGFAGMIFTIQTARELVRFGAVDYRWWCICFSILSRISTNFNCEYYRRTSWFSFCGRIRGYAGDGAN